MTAREQGSRDELLSAYLDGEVTPGEKAQVERLLEQDEQARRRLHELQMAADAVASLPRHAAPPAVAEDVILHIERTELLGSTTKETRLAGRRLVVPAAISMAAVLGLAVGVAWVMFGQASGPAELFDRVDSPSPDVAAARSRNVADEEMERLDRAADAVPPAPTALLAMASFERKMEAGLGIESVKNHAFANEPLRLQVPVRTENEVRAVTDRLAAVLLDQRIVNLGEHLKGRNGDVSAPSEFFYFGRPNVNFAASGEEQVLVRARKTDLLNVLDRLVDSTPDAERMAFQAGPIAVRGAAQIHSALGGFRGVASNGSTDDAGKETPPAGTTGPRYRAARQSDESSIDPAEGFDKAMEDFLALLGLEPAILEGLSTPSHAPAEGPADAPEGQLAQGPDVPVSDEALASTETLKPDVVAGASPRSGHPEETGGAVTHATTQSSSDDKTSAVSFVGERDREESGAVAPSLTTAVDNARKRPKAANGHTTARVEEPSSLVHRRLADLERARRRAGETAGKKFEPAKDTSLQPAAQPLDPFVTLVIQLIPAQPEPTSRPRPTEAHEGRHQPASEPAKSNGVQ